MLTLPETPNKDEITTVSPSQLDIWFKCRYHWKLSYKDNYTTGKTIHMIRGSMTHFFLERFYGQFLNGPVGPLDMDLAWKWKNELETEYQGIQHLAMINWAFQTFLRYADWAAETDDFIPVLVEQELHVPTGLEYDGRPVYLHGFPDLIFDRAGELGVIDHKSHYQEKGAWTSDMVYFDQQVLFYMLMFHKLGYTPTVGIINSINTFEYKSVDSKGRALPPQPAEKLFNRQEVYHKPRLLDAYEQELLQIIDEMQTVGHFPKRRNKDCRFCGYKEVCDTELRGQNSTPLLRMKHSKDTELVQFESPLELA